MYNAIILSAGKGSRMKADQPKGSFRILYRPMVIYSIDALQKAGVEDINIVVGYKKEVIEEITQGFNCNYREQKELNGTAKAVETCKDLLENKEGTTIILPVDMPLVNERLIESIMEYHEKSDNDLTVLSTKIDNPFGYGRIIRSNVGTFECIKEELDCTPEEKFVNEINSGVYCVNTKLLFKALSKVKNNNKKGEYYLTDIVSIMKADGYKAGAYMYDRPEETLGVNDLNTLSYAESILRKKINSELMANGTYIINPDTVTIGPDVIVGRDVVIEPNTYIYGSSTIGDGSRIGPNSEVFNSKIENDCWIRHSIVFDSYIDSFSTVGPFAHIRMNSHIGPNNKVGNFVEVKNSVTGSDTKASHLGYIGDSDFGKNINFGCGCITCNYDGKNKWRTTVGDNVFIGSNSNLIAPIKVEDNAFIAAGSTLNKNVPEGAFAIARPFQVTKDNYAHRLREKAFEKSKKKKD